MVLYQISEDLSSLRQYLLDLSGCSFKNKSILMGQALELIILLVAGMLLEIVISRRAL